MKLEWSEDRDADEYTEFTWGSDADVALWIKARGSVVYGLEWSIEYAECTPNIERKIKWLNRLSRHVEGFSVDECKNYLGTFAMLENTGAVEQYCLVGDRR